MEDIFWEFSFPLLIFFSLIKARQKLIFRFTHHSSKPVFPPNIIYVSDLIAYYFFVFSVLILTEFLTLYPLHRGRPNYLEGPQETLMQIGLPDCHQGTHRGWIYLILRQIWAAAVGLWKMKILRLLRTCQWPRKLPKMSLNIVQVTQIWNFPSKQNIQEWKRNTDQGKQTAVHICDRIRKHIIDHISTTL